MAETKTFYVMVMTRCVIDGELSDSFDLSTRMILAASEAEVRSRVEAESPHSYQNPAGETVEWPLSRIMSIDRALRFDLI